MSESDYDDPATWPIEMRPPNYLTDAELIARLRERYDGKSPPDCHVCGKAMAVHGMGMGRITYGCSGQSSDGTYATGRSFADEHFGRSVREVMAGDGSVSELCKRFEAEQARAARLRHALGEVLDTLDIDFEVGPLARTLVGKLTTDGDLGEEITP